MLVILSAACSPNAHNKKLPAFMIGQFEDDYGIQYQIDQGTFVLLPNDKFHIIRVDTIQRYLILHNDSLNAFAPSLYSRIDYQTLKNMAPFQWAFCFSNYEEESYIDALSKQNKSKSDLMKGCNEFPFSRMKSKHTRKNN